MINIGPTHSALSHQNHVHIQSLILAVNFLRRKNVFECDIDWMKKILRKILNPSYIFGGEEEEDEAGGGREGTALGVIWAGCT